MEGWGVRGVDVAEKRIPEDQVEPGELGGVKREVLVSVQADGDVLRGHIVVRADLEDGGIRQVDGVDGIIGTAA